jgi:hypothetical protein
LTEANRALDEGQPHELAWALVHAERFRAMRIYKEMFEEPLWMAQSAKRLIDFLALWNEHQANGDEGFWQTILTKHSYVLSQAFSASVVFVRERAYVGGQNIDGKAIATRFSGFICSDIKPRRLHPAGLVVATWQKEPPPITSEAAIGWWWIRGPHIAQFRTFLAI